MSWAARLWSPLRHWLPYLTGRTGLCAGLGVCAALAAPPSAAVAAPSDIAVIITNAAYDDASIPAVKYAANDGAAVETAMTQVFGVQRDNLHKIQNATYGRLRSLFGPEGHPEQSEIFKWVQGARTKPARVYIYYTGHGTPHVREDGAGTDAYLVTKDASFDNLPATAYALKTLRDNLAAIRDLMPEGQIVLILEACFSGRTGNDEPLRPGTSQIPLTYDFGGAPGALVELDAAQSNQAAFWDEKTRHGVFTDQLLFGIYGQADSPEHGGNGDGQVTLAEIEAFLNRQIADRLEVNRRNGVQTPKISGAGELALATGGPKQRPDTRLLEAEEAAQCASLEKAENENYTRLGEDMARIRKFLDEECRLCACRAKLESRHRYLEEKQQVCLSVAGQIQTRKDPAILQYFADQNQCPQLHDALLQQVKILQDIQQQTVCAEDQAKWDEAKHGDSMQVMELAVATMSCASVRDGARAEMERRRKAQATIAAMKSKAEDLGTLTAGRPLERKGSVTGEDTYWKFQVAADDIVGIQLFDLTANLDVDLRDSSYEIVAKPRQSGPSAKDIQTADKLKPGAVYYIRIAPAEGGRGASYALRVAPGAIREFSRPDLAAQAALGGFLTSTLFGNDAEYYARFSLRNPAGVSIELTWADRQADLDMELLREETGRRPALQKKSIAPAAGRRVADAVLQAGTYLVRVKRNAGSSPETKITLNLRSGAPSSSRDLAVPLVVGAEPVLHTLPANENEYWGRFSLAERSKLTAVLNWSDKAVDLDMEVSDDGGKVISRSSGTIPTERVDPLLDPGTYLVHIYRSAPTSQASAPFRLTLIGQSPAPPQGGR